LAVSPRAGLGYLPCGEARGFDGADGQRRRQARAGSSFLPRKIADVVVAAWTAGN